MCKFMHRFMDFRTFYRGLTKEGLGPTQVANERTSEILISFERKELPIVTLLDILMHIKIFLIVQFS